MKKWNISITALVIAAVITLCIYYFYKKHTSFTNFSSVSQSVEITDIPANDTAFGTLFATLNINDSVPYYVYKIAADSFKKITDLRDFDNKGMGTGISTSFVGVVVMRKIDYLFNKSLQWDPLFTAINDSIQELKKKQDTIQSKIVNPKIAQLTARLQTRANDFDKELDEKEKEQYFLALKNYDIDFTTKFFIKNSTYNLAYVKSDTTTKNLMGQSTKHGHYEHKQIPVRYDTDNKSILIPITKYRYHLLYNAISVLFFSSSLIMLYFFVGLPLKLLINIAQGDAFNKKNVTYLKTMSYLAFACYIIGIAFVFIIRFIFRDIIPCELHAQPFTVIIFDKISFFLAGIALFIIAKAFERGYNLQTDQDLTI